MRSGLIYLVSSSTSTLNSEDVFEGSAGEAFYDLFCEVVFSDSRAFSMSYGAF